jgi:hypothetical protein
MVSRDAKRISSRSTIRMQTRIAKGFQQRYVMPMETGIKPSSDIATDRPEVMCMASGNVNWFDRHICSRMELLIKDRAVIRKRSCSEPRIHMRENSWIDCYVVTQIYKWIGNPISMRLLTRVNMLVVNRMGTTKAMQTGMPMGARIAPRVPERCHKRVSIGCVSWTGTRVPSYYGRHDSARRDSTRRPAEGRQR